MGKALYRKYRSRSLDEIVGQEHVTALLTRALQHDRVAHAYLFTGPRGVGKTSIARILAHEINDLPYSDESTHLDIIEIDAASNNGVDDIRDLRDKVQLAPVSAKKKVYIIDEVHMLSKPAFNALLKTLEEPPEHVVFILATTDLEKLPETIVSRTQRHTFARASTAGIIKNLQMIAKKESIVIDDDALELIAEHSDGSYRDSVSLLDQLQSLVEPQETITRTLVEQSLGLAPKDLLQTLIDALQKKEYPAVVSALQALESRGIQAAVIARQLVFLLRSHALEHPQFLQLIAPLLEVSQSSLPSAKLFVTLGKFAAPQAAPAKTMAARASAPIPELAKEAAKEHPKETRVSPKKPVAPTATPKPENEKPQPKQANATVALEDFDEVAFRAACKQHGIALASVLDKSQLAVEDHRLAIYAGTKFYHQKLTSSRFMQHLHDALNQQCPDAEIVVHPMKKPSSNSQVAAIAAMMGGGEEVEYSE